MINALLSADADRVCGAEWNARTAKRTNRNGYPDAIVRLIGAVPAGQTDEWAEGRRYHGLEVLGRC